jgi:beta-phosphoglucomutase
MIRAILFDFNGVIINDEPLQMKAYQEIFKKDEIDLTEADYYSCMGMDDRAFITEIFMRNAKSLSEERLLEISAQKTEAWRKLVSKEVPSFEGVENFVRIAAKHFLLGVVSMAKREEIEFALEKLGLRDLFSVIVSSEDAKTHKPNPECYNLGFSRMDAIFSNSGDYPLTRKECLVIEDSPQGIQAGKAARMKTLGVTNTVSREVLHAAGAISVTKSLGDWSVSAINRVF